MSTARQREVWNRATRKWNEKNPGYKAEKIAKWRADNPELAQERQQAQDKRYYEANKERVAAKNRKWRLHNADKLRAYAVLYRARKRNQACECCDKKEFYPLYIEARSKGLEVDHVHPLSKGGKHCMTNLQLLTPRENRVKGSQLIELGELL